MDALDRHIFSILDPEASGIVDRGKLRVGMRRLGFGLGDFSEDVLAAMLASASVEGSNTISFEAFATALSGEADAAGDGGRIAALLEGSAAERERAYTALEAAMRGGRRAPAGSDAEDGWGCLRTYTRSVALAITTASRLLSVLCCDSARVPAAEFQRASLVLAAMGAQLPTAVQSAIHTDLKTANVCKAPGGVVTSIWAKANEPSAVVTKEDALCLAAFNAHRASLFGPGLAMTFKRANISALDWAEAFMAEPHRYYIFHTGFICFLQALGFGFFTGVY